MWYDVPSISLVDWLAGVVSLLSNSLDAVAVNPILNFFSIVPVFFMSCAILYDLARRGRRK